MRQETKKNLLYTGAGLTLGTGAVLAIRPGLRRAMMHSIKSIGKGGSRAVAASEAIHPNALKTADEVGRMLAKQGIDPRKAKIAIVAAPGTGKSTMARALDAQLGIKNLSLDKARGGGYKGKKAVRYLKDKHEGIMPGGHVLEQTFMPHTTNLDQFDAVIHLSRDVGVVNKQIMKRGKGAWQADYVNYPRLQGQIRESFDSLGGLTTNMGGGTQLKVRPKGGTFESVAGRLKRARELGLDLDKFKRMSQSKQVQSLEKGKLVRTPGVLSAFRVDRQATDLALVSGGGIGGYMYSKKKNRTS